MWPCKLTRPHDGNLHVRSYEGAARESWKTDNASSYYSILAVAVESLKHSGTHTFLHGLEAVLHLNMWLLQSVYWGGGGSLAEFLHMLILHTPLQQLTSLGLDQLGCGWHYISELQFHGHGYVRFVAQNVHLTEMKHWYVGVECLQQCSDNPPAVPPLLHLNHSHSLPWSVQGQSLNPVALQPCFAAFQQLFPFKQNFQAQWKYPTAEDVWLKAGEFSFHSSRLIQV